MRYNGQLRIWEYLPGDIIRCSQTWGLKTGPGLSLVNVEEGTLMFVVCYQKIQLYYDREYVEHRQHEPHENLTHALFVIAQNMMGWLYMIDRDDDLYIHLVTRY